jgi:hypothetical protein
MPELSAGGGHLLEGVGDVVHVPGRSKRSRNAKQQELAPVGPLCYREDAGVVGDAAFA